MPHDPTWRRMAPTGERGVTGDADVWATIALKPSKHRGERTVRLVVGDETVELHPDLAGEMAAELMTSVDRSLYGDLSKRHDALRAEVDAVTDVLAMAHATLHGNATGPDASRAVAEIASVEARLRAAMAWRLTGTTPDGSAS